MLETNNRALVIGLDGATFDLMRPWMEQGKLPNLQKLCLEGVSGQLRSTIPFNSAVAWSAFITGKNPGNNNVYDFFYRPQDSYDIRFINSRSRRAASFWKIIGSVGKKVGIINVPVTFPPEEVNGFLIAGMMSPEVNEAICYPPELFKELKTYLGEYTIKIFGKEYVRKKKYGELQDAIARNDEIHYQITKYLLTRKCWDLFCVVFTGTDHISHYFWHFMDPNHPLYDQANAKHFQDAICKVYARLDEYIGNLLECVDDNVSVIVLSDHGHGPNCDIAVYLNHWLAREGYLTFRKSRIGSFKGTALRDWSRSIIKLARKYIPRKYKNKIRAVPRIRSKLETLYRVGDIDWEKTVAFSDDVRENIWVNVKGRFPLGKVQAGQEYDHLRDEIIEKIKEFRNPDTGERVFTEVLKREEVYCGKFVDLAPDILLKQKEDSYTYVPRSSNATLEKVPIKRFTREDLGSQRAVVASHRINGVLIMRGKAVQQNKIIHSAQIIDIAPTIFYLMGTPIPEDWDGRVLTEAIREDYLRTHPPQYTKGKTVDYQDDTFTYSSAEEETIADQLRGLGYIE